MQEEGPPVINLHHASAVVRPGRAFVRSLIDASATVQQLEHWVHLNTSARLDIIWWFSFVRSWNGVSLWPSSEPLVVMTSDASGA